MDGDSCKSQLWEIREGQGLWCHSPTKWILKWAGVFLATRKHLSKYRSVMVHSGSHRTVESTEKGILCIPERFKTLHYHLMIGLRSEWICRQEVLPCTLISLRVFCGFSACHTMKKSNSMPIQNIWKQIWSSPAYWKKKGKLSKTGIKTKQGESGHTESTRPTESPFLLQVEKKKISLR